MAHKALRCHGLFSKTISYIKKEIISTEILDIMHSMGILRDKAPQNLQVNNIHYLFTLWVYI